MFCLKEIPSIFKKSVVPLISNSVVMVYHNQLIRNDTDLDEIKQQIEQNGSVLLKN